MRRLTARELALIYIAVLMLMASLGFWLIHNTAYAYYAEAVNDLEFAKMERQVAANHARSGEDYKYQLAEGQRYYQEHGKDLAPLKSEVELETEILSYLEACGLSPESTNVEPVSAMETDEKMTEIYKSSIHLTARGNIDRICSFFRLIGEKANLKVEEFHMSGTGETLRSDIKITCYMADAEVGTYENFDRE